MDFVPDRSFEPVHICQYGSRQLTIDFLMPSSRPDMVLIRSMPGGEADVLFEHSEDPHNSTVTEGFNSEAGEENALATINTRVEGARSPNESNTTTRGVYVQRDVLIHHSSWFRERLQAREFNQRLDLDAPMVIVQNALYFFYTGRLNLPESDRTQEDVTETRTSGFTEEYIFDNNRPFPVPHLCDLFVLAEQLGANDLMNAALTALFISCSEDRDEYRDLLSYVPHMDPRSERLGLLVFGKLDRTTEEEQILQDLPWSQRGFILPGEFTRDCELTHAFMALSDPTEATENLNLYTIKRQVIDEHIFCAKYHDHRNRVGAPGPREFKRCFDGDVVSLQEFNVRRADYWQVLNLLNCQ